MRKSFAVAVACVASVFCVDTSGAQPDVAALSALGKHVFFDDISVPATQACVSCHDPGAGWTSPDATVNAGPVVLPGAFGTSGNRKPPTVGYAAFSSNFGSCDGSLPQNCSGGNFWDGRATGQTVGPEVFDGDPELQAAYEGFLGPLADQALGPFGNPVEHNIAPGSTTLPAAEGVCAVVAAAPYAPLFEVAWGEPLDCTPAGADLSFKRIGVAISAWEHSDEVISFSSLRDLALLNDTDGVFPLDDLTAEENLGHDLFFSAAKCFRCHEGLPAGDAELAGSEPRQLYLDNSFHHLGLPPNFDAANFDSLNPDLGLAEFTGDPLHEGAFRTPSLRNVDRRPDSGFTKAYMHNGYFKTLEDVVHFYNTATIKTECPAGTTAADARLNDCWPAPEIDNGRQASAFGLLGNLGLTPAEEAAIVAYLRTLNDSVEVTEPAASPEAAASRHVMLANTTAVLDLLALVFDPDGDLDPGTLQILSPPVAGILQDSGGGVFDYLPALDFVGTDAFAFEACDVKGNCDSAVVTIDVVTIGEDLIEFGSTTVDDTFSTVVLSHAYVDPVVVCTSNFRNNVSPVVVRMRNVTPTSFEVRLQNPAGNAVVPESVSYIVVESGTWQIGGHRFEAQKYPSTVTDSTSSFLGEAQSYAQPYTSPVVIGQVMTENDSRWSAFWDSGAKSFQPPSAQTLFTGKMVGEDPDVDRAAETVGFIVFESGHGAMPGFEFEAMVGDRSVAGVDDTPPNLYTFDTAFASPPDAAVVSMAGMVGANGGWAQTHGADPLSQDSIALSIDEDQLNDTERNHTTERVAYVAFRTIALPE